MNSGVIVFETEKEARKSKLLKLINMFLDYGFTVMPGPSSMIHSLSALNDIFLKCVMFCEIIQCNPG